MGNRYDNRVIRTNGEDIYKDILDERGLKKVKQYTTPILNDLNSEKRGSLDRIRHIWTVGDRLYKLAAEYYGDSEMWWVIGWYNQKPTESHFKIGDTLLIPLPLEEVLGYFYESKSKRD